MKNLKHRITALTLAGIMAFAPVGGIAFADDEANLVEPEKPVVESYEDNDKITEYNSKVDEYNKSAEAYNESVDREYEAAVEETAQKNEEIAEHNAAELERVQTAEENNRKAEAEAEEANAQIDMENAAEEERVNEHNMLEDEKVKASEEAIAAANEENEAIKAHNEAVARYGDEKAQYDADFAQYEKDAAMEKKILAAGYSSVEQYNDMINTRYNEPAKKSVERNASAKEVSASDTYTVKEADEKAGVKVPVHIEHVFEGTDISYVEDFEIDRNDIISINSIAALGNATEDGMASLYYKTDEEHSMGYWVPYDMLYYNSKYLNYNWNCGTSYEVSYKDGTNHANDEEVIEAYYTYIWIPMKSYKTYNVPSAPTAPENPGELKEMVEVPEVYTANYEKFEKKEHVTAALEEVKEANILESIMAPVKKAYIKLLEHMDLFEVPEEPQIVEEPQAETPAEEIAEEPQAEAPVEEIAEEPQAEAAPAEEIAEEPQAEAPVEEIAEEPQAEAAPAEEIAEEPQVTEEVSVQEIPEETKVALITETKVPEAKASGTKNEVNVSADDTAEEVQTAQIDDQKMPKAETAEPADITIDDGKTPLAETPSWALLNLIFTIFTLLTSAVLVAGYFGKRKEENDDEEEVEINRKGIARFASLVPAAAAAIIFILTENMANPMVLTDRWTVLMALILLIQAVPAIMARKESEDSETDETVVA